MQTFNNKLTERYIGEHLPQNDVNADNPVSSEGDTDWSNVAMAWESTDTPGEAKINDASRRKLMNFLFKKAHAESEQLGRTGSARSSAVYIDDVRGKHDGPWGALHSWAWESRQASAPDDTASYF